LAKEQFVNIGNHSLKLSNLDKILFSNPDISKAEWIQYYYKHSKIFLELNSKRALSLIRFPDGISGTKFYTKNAPDFTPDFIEKKSIGDINYLIANNVEDLIWFCNLAALEIHMMPLRFPESKADFFIFDLDPPVDLPFSNTKALAILLKKFLENHNYHPLIKTSGSKGLHIFVPILLEYNTEQIIQTCNELTKEFVNQYQDLCTSFLRKDKRDHKIFIDINRNHNSQTIVSPYSTRAISGAPISMPLRWEDIDTLESSQYYTIFNIDDYHQKYGYAWKNYIELRSPLHLFRTQAPIDLNEKTETAPKPMAEKIELIEKTKIKKRFALQLSSKNNFEYILSIETDKGLESWRIPKGIPQENSLKRLAIKNIEISSELILFEESNPIYHSGFIWLMDTGICDQELKANKNFTISFSGKLLSGIVQFNYLENDNWLIEKKNNFIDYSQAIENKHMLAIATQEIPDSKLYQFEIKWDGIRVFIFINNKSVKIISRGGRDITRQFPELHSLNENIAFESMCIDAEIVSLDDQGKPIFANIISRLHSKSSISLGEKIKKYPAVIYAFDIIELDGLNITEFPLTKRRELLQKGITVNATLRFSDSFEDGQLLYDAVKKMDLEGIIAKRKTSNYYFNNRSANWLKFKTRNKAECFVIGYTIGEGDRNTTFGSLYVAVIEDGKFVYRGRIGTGFDQNKLTFLIEIFNGISKVKKHPLYSQIVEENESYWLSECPWIQVQYASLTPNETYREGVYIRLMDNIDNVPITNLE